MRTIKTILWTLVVGAAVALTYAYSGSFDVAADSLDTPLTAWLVQAVRERSIAVRANDLTVPQLDNADMIARGADEYAEMCAGCHLGPGVADNEFRQGLNPAAPELATSSGQVDAARLFWIVKHGIKMTGMPAWGRTHDDATLWSIVAFLQKLPTLTPQQYAELTADSEAAHEEHDRMQGADE